MDSGSYMDRAFRAYFRSGETEQPSSDSSTLEECQGLRYIVLRNCNGVLAVYRIRNSGRLKRLKRWSIQIEVPRPEENEHGFQFGFTSRDYEIMRLQKERRAKMRKVRNANTDHSG
jgi:hypothetical protein